MPIKPQHHSLWLHEQKKRSGRDKTSGDTMSLALIKVGAPEYGAFDPSRTPPARISRRMLGDLSFMLDWAAVSVGQLTALCLVKSTAPAPWHATLLCGAVAALWLKRAGAYDMQARRDHRKLRSRILQAVCIGMAVSAALSSQLLVGDFGHIFSLGLAFTFSATFAATTQALAGLLMCLAADYGLIGLRIAVVGTGEIALALRSHCAIADLNTTLVGTFYSSKPFGPDADVIAANGSLDDLIEAAHAGYFDKVVIALPSIDGSQVEDLMSRLDTARVDIDLATGVSFEHANFVPSERLKMIGPVVVVPLKLVNYRRVILKQVLDWISALCLLIACMPLIAAIACAIKLDSSGPVFFLQRRRGINGAIFRICKFRTMTVAEDSPRVEQARLNDVRVTRVGRWLRRTSLDEIPQFYNVLKGEMSLVGPRPHALDHDITWSEKIARYTCRQRMKPGMTGLAQVRGYRGEIKSLKMLAARVDSDLEYVRHWSLALDLWILVRTLSVVTKATNSH